MKELKYPENIKLEQFDIEVRPYLYLTEKKQIVEQMLMIENPLERELCMWSIIFNVCCGIDEGTDYDLLCATGVKTAILEILWVDIEEIYDAVAESESTMRFVAAFLNDMSKLADETIKKIPTGSKLDKLVDKFTKFVGEQDGGDK
jgi:hypothetical protein